MILQTQVLENALLAVPQYERSTCTDYRLAYHLLPIYYQVKRSRLGSQVADRRFAGLSAHGLGITGFHRLIPGTRVHAGTNLPRA